MGYNRSGKRRTERLKRAKRHEERLLKKLIAAQESGPATAAPATAKK
jgi:hypothetical protein